MHFNTISSTQKYCLKLKVRGIFIKGKELTLMGALKLDDSLKIDGS